MLFLDDEVLLVISKSWFVVVVVVVVVVEISSILDNKSVKISKNGNCQFPKGMSLDMSIRGHP